jgi:agmatine deiminase
VQLLPEWAPQEAVILAWPDQYTDWRPWLTEARQVYVDLIQTLNQAGTGVLLLIREEEVEGFKQSATELSKVLLLLADYDDTWLRDYGFLTCQSEAGMQAIEFTFNGWGNKFDASKDNLINGKVLAPLCRLPLQSFANVVEGGALEIDEQGHLLSTKLCLTNPQRNGELSLGQYQQLFSQTLGAKKVSIFEHGHLEGDDTDGHIDTLVRFTPDKGLVIQSAFNRPQDSHYEGLAALVAECKSKLPEHKIFELPLPYITAEDGDRLPASYANYLISNKQVLCPIYMQAEDQLALSVLEQAYPQYTIMAINCLPLVQQYGSLHCVSMQVPSGTLKDQVLEQLNQGVSQWQAV